MLKELVDRLVGLGEAQAAPSEHSSGARNKRLFWADGKFETVTDDIRARTHEASDLDTLAAYTDASNSAVWHCRCEVVAVLDDSPESYRDDTVKWSLNCSKKWSALANAATPRTHAEFVHFLVENLRDEIESGAPGLLGVIRNLRFRSVDESEGKVQQGRESMGRAIESEIAGAGDLPETIVVMVRRWAVLDYLAPVECLLKLDTTNRKLSLVPLADEREQAELKAQEWLHELIAGAVECPVYHGRP